ncbi:MAG: hypothetical protein J5562_01980 [Clostridia bacterium]|nr:hypothetical protein [Clostridia bacterium]
MKRKFFPVLLAFIVLLGALSVGASAVTSAGTEAALVNGFAKGGEYKLTKSLTITHGLVVPEGKTVSLDLNGKTLDRGLAVCVDGGSVITVMPGAKFTLRDTSGTNDGIITGGAALNGGGICNYGDTTIEAGTIYNNKATDNTYGCGGGIYNGYTVSSDAKLTIKGGVIYHNRARNGGGVYNATGCEVTVLEGSYIKSIGNIKKTITDNVKITENSASGYGGGIFNSGDFYISGSPTVTGNTGGTVNDDIHSSYEKNITLSGKLTCSGKISLSGEGSNPTAVAKYNTYNTGSPTELFKASKQGDALILGSNGEIIIKNTIETTVQVLNGGKVTKLEKHLTVESAWNSAKNHASSGSAVEVVLGSDYDKDARLIVPNNCSFTLDLNGHYINRARNGSQTDDGEVIYVGDGATFTVRDSNPDSMGYDGIFGGVITGGASENGAGGVHVRPNATFNMYGGTIYRCTTDEHGGAILLKDGAKLNMKDCCVYFCQTIDSTDESHGGGIAAKCTCTINLENVTFQDCYSEDGGGAIYLSDYDSSGYINCLIKNCLFTGNIAEDNGGAVYIFLNGNRSSFKTVDCIYRNNKAGSQCSGGAIYVNGTSEGAKHKVLIENCEIKNNRASWHGGGVFVGRGAVVLMDCTITDNYSGRSGAVYVFEEVTVSFAGKMIVKDNSASYNGANLCLDDTNSTEKHTYFESAGLCEGSEIRFYVGDRGGVPVARHITQYQTKYFIPEHGTMEFIPEKTLDTPVMTASLFGKGSVIILGSFAAAAAALAGIIIYKKKKGGAPADENNG